MVRGEELAVDLLTTQGWYRGSITLPAGGRLLDYLNSRPLMIALTEAVGPAGVRHSCMAVNLEQILAIRPSLED